MQRKATRTASQLGVSYRRGPLGGRGRGDRVPDRDCTRADGTRTRLHAELFPSWVVLGPDALLATAREHLGDVTVLRGAGEPMLIRPDGHVAWRGDDPEALRRWFAKAPGWARDH